MLGVRNNDKERLVAKYDGKEYVFEVSTKENPVTTAISEDAARHIFGFGEKDKKRSLLRLGWVPNGTRIDAALERLGKFQFLAVEEVKFRDEEPVASMPRNVAEQAGAENRDLSPQEIAHGAKTLSKPEGQTKQFGKR
jgi:hypothetical protein